MLKETDYLGILEKMLIKQDGNQQQRQSLVIKTITDHRLLIDLERCLREIYGETHVKINYSNLIEFPIYWTNALKLKVDLKNVEIEVKEMDSHIVSFMASIRTITVKDLGESQFEYAIELEKDIVFPDSVVRTYLPIGFV